MGRFLYRWLLYDSEKCDGNFVKNLKIRLGFEDLLVCVCLG